jgi:ribonucleotide reductase alpha subunit
MVALMPTASTSQILGSTESVEGFGSMIHSRRTLAGDFLHVNKHLVRELEERGLWSVQMGKSLVRARGSIHGIASIPDDVKAVYKTVWELKQRRVIELSAERGPFVCQSESMNLHFSGPTHGKVIAALYHGWRLGLKTGLYYARTQPIAQAIAFTVDKSEEEEVASCKVGDEGCVSCGS